MAKKKKNASGTGTSYQRPNGTWSGQLTLPDGTRKTVYGKKQRDVIRKMDAIRHDIAGGTIINESQTVGEYLASWNIMVKHAVKKRTASTYEHYTSYHTQPIKAIPLAKLTPQHIQHLYTAKLDSGLSSTTVRHLHAVLHRAFERAVRLGLMSVNVTNHVEPPRMREAAYTTLTAEQGRILLQSSADQRFAALYVVALTTGMREGELFGLQWPQVDLQRGILKVTTNLQVIKGGFELDTPKSAKSRRSIILSQTAREALIAHKVKQEAERMEVGEAWDTSWDLVFPNTIGRPVNPANFLRRNFKTLLARAGLPRIRFHDLRHTAATLLLEAGIHPKVVSEMLGHASITITLSLYSHVTPAMHEPAAAAMDVYFQGNAPLQ